MTSSAGCSFFKSCPFFMISVISFFTAIVARGLLIKLSMKSLRYWSGLPGNTIYFVFNGERVFLQSNYKSSLAYTAESPAWVQILSFPYLLHIGVCFICKNKPSRVSVSAREVKLLPAAEHRRNTYVWQPYSIMTQQKVDKSYFLLRFIYHFKPIWIYFWDWCH